MGASIKGGGFALNVEYKLSTVNIMPYIERYIIERNILLERRLKLIIEIQQGKVERDYYIRLCILPTKQKGDEEQLGKIKRQIDSLEIELEIVEKMWKQLEKEHPLDVEISK